MAAEGLHIRFTGGAVPLLLTGVCAAAHASLQTKPGDDQVASTSTSDAVKGMSVEELLQLEEFGTAEARGEIERCIFGRVTCRF